MKRKYLTITYLHVLLPFKSCSIRFLIKQPQTITVAPELPFISRPLSKEVSELVTFEYDGKSQLMLFVLAVKTQERERVVSLGGTRIDLKQDGDIKGILQGVEGQKGYIIYRIDNQIKKTDNQVRKTQNQPRKIQSQLSKNENQNDQPVEKIKKSLNQPNGGKDLNEKKHKKAQIPKNIDSNQQPLKNILKSSLTSVQNHVQNHAQNHVQNHVQDPKIIPAQSSKPPASPAPARFLPPMKIVMSQQKLSEVEQIPSLDLHIPSPGVFKEKMQPNNKPIEQKPKVTHIFDQSQLIQKEIMKHKLKNAGYRQVLLKNELFQQQYKRLLPK